MGLGFRVLGFRVFRVYRDSASMMGSTVPSPSKPSVSRSFKGAGQGALEGSCGIARAVLTAQRIL